MALDNELAVDIIQSVGRYWSDNELSDCRISVDGQVFQASRFHLSACSEFFRQVFHTESITHKENIVIKGISADVFSCVIKALFTGVTGLDESNMVDVWLAASYLKIGFFVKKSEQFIAEHLTAQNCLQLYERISCMGSADINKKLVILMAQNFEEFRKTETFLNLPSEMVIEIVESGEIKSQDSLVESVLKWASHVPKDVVGTFNTKFYIDIQDVMETGCDNPYPSFCFSNEHLCHFVADEVRRVESLGQILIKVKTGKLSETGLKILFEDTHAMSDQNVKDAIMRELADRMLYKSDMTVARCDNNQVNITLPNIIESLTPTSLCFVNLECFDTFEIPEWAVSLYIEISKPVVRISDYDTMSLKYQGNEHVVVYLINQTFVMQDLYSNTPYVLHKAVDRVQYFNVYENILYYSVKMPQINVHTVVSLNETEIVYEGYDSTSHTVKYFMTFHFIYKFKIYFGNLHVEKRLSKESSKENWKEVFKIPLSSYEFEFHSTLVIVDKILFFATGESTKIFYFDIKSEKVHELYTIAGKFSNFKIFTKSCENFMLLGSGQLLQILNDGAISIVFSEQLWTGTLTLHGAVFRYNYLYVCTDSRAEVKLNRSKIFSLVKFVTTATFTWNRQCENMTVKKDGLVNKI